ncbi:Phomenoic acid biosynthesis cluster cytochrome P450 monooxygenase [Paramyrothecium foliicola]|nr:Phomenoic acid biosynthesis cluster cytochrome P450 monooxygenase [Paramyrothecium foliicola]
MLSLYLLLGAAVAYWFLTVYSRLQANIAKAKNSGLHYVVARVLRPIWKPIVSLLPKSWTQDWVPSTNSRINDSLTDINVFWTTKTAYFEKYGSMFLLVSPSRHQVYVANAEVIHQVTGSLDRFPKDISRYGPLRLYGENLLTADVATWKVHRKAVSSSFNEENAALVFYEAVRQSKTMLQVWTDSAGNRKETLRTLEQDTMRLALNVISYVGFGLSLLWPGQSWSKETASKLFRYESPEAPQGHGLSFADTMKYVLEHFFFLVILPVSVLKRLPMKGAKLAAQAHQDFALYMSELMNEKRDEARSSNRPKVGMDLMGQLVRSRNDGRGQVAAQAGQDRPLSRDEIVGTAFLILLAGHETSANVLHFSIVELAANPASQRRLQEDIDNLVGDTLPETWSYESLVNGMMGSMLAAVMNETLRLLPPVVDTPKMVSKNHDQVVKMDGRDYTLAANAGVSILTAPVHRMPRYWPTKPSKIHAGKSDIDDFVPERWFEKHGPYGNDSREAGVDAEISEQLFRPAAGAFVPFSAGARSCIGRRIAQVEIIAMLAVFFQTYSVELAVDEWASDEEVSGMSKQEARRVYGLAQTKTRETLATVETLLTLKLHGKKHVPLRLVKRGEERFVNWL